MMFDDEMTNPTEGATEEGADGEATEGTEGIAPAEGTEGEAASE